MALAPDILLEFRTRLHQARASNPDAWERSKACIEQSRTNETITRLLTAIGGAALPIELRRHLIEVLGGSSGKPALRPEALKLLTGLPPSKSLRALCVLFSVLPDATGSPAMPSPAEVEAFARAHSNPYELLLEVVQPAVLDLGAGDLSFAADLVDHFLGPIRERGKRLTLHCVERLRPGSRWGGRLHVNPAYAQRLLGRPGDPPRDLHFRFFGDQDMLALDAVELAARYTIVTCHGPATPTFAYEPTRISASRIDDHLRATKGAYRRIHEQGEDALEVRHGASVLLFPPWKFDIKGPLALLAVLARRGSLALMGAIDDEVFWEILSQLLDDEQFRPPDVIFTPATRPAVFGSIHRQLTALPPGATLDLAQLAPLRRRLPLLDSAQEDGYRFRYVEVRRGALFDGMPAGQTARLFGAMTEEPPPWFLLLVPEPLPS